jgi:hypothetical protein
MFSTEKLAENVSDLTVVVDDQNSLGLARHVLPSIVETGDCWLARPMPTPMPANVRMSPPGGQFAVVAITCLLSFAAW